MAAALLLGGPALGCEIPDEPANTPWRRAVAKVRYLPDIEGWALAEAREGYLVQYVVLLDAPERADGRCYWPVEVRSRGALWRRFLVSPDGSRVREDRRR